MTNITQEYYVEKVGEGEPVLFLPAAGFAGNEGLNIAVHMKENFETHMIDLPGLGKSKGLEGRVTSKSLANWVKTYMDQCEIDSVSLIGHSLGGAVLLAFAVHYPERVKKLILLDQGHKPFPRVPIAEFGSFAYVLPFLNVCVHLFGKRFLNKLTPFFTQQDEQKKDELSVEVKEFCERISIVENEYVRLAVKEAPNITEEGLSLMFGYYNLNLPKLLKSVKVKTCLVYGTFENINEKEYRNTRKYIQKMLKYKNLPITYYPIKSGHYVHWSESTILDVLKGFLI
nr:alpha/beta hydrolase [Radiobacillus kanasensis]